MGLRWALYSSNSSCRNVFSRESQATITAAGLVLAEDLDDHGAEAVEGVGGKTVGGGDLRRQGEERPVGDVVAVEQEERPPVARGD